MTSSSSKLFDRSFCSEFGVLPAQTRNGSLELFWTDGSDLSIVDYVRFVSKTPVVLRRIDTRLLKERIQNMFGDSDDIGERSTPVAMNSSATASSTSAVVAEIDRIIGESITEGASDIHFEPSEQALCCRVRLDGMLVEKIRIARESMAETISRLKIMAGLDIAEKRRPQDGRIRFEHDNRIVDIRVSIIPTDFGEKAVLRILDKATLRLDLKAIGFTPEQHAVFVEQISLPNGIVLVTGPTGSGKTTTLYAALNHLRSPEVNISTVEDPIEYNLEGINQTQVKPEINLTFAAMLRALLRQDPNIIMVGEIRDRDTLDIAIRASMTGHLVLSTLHTNSAIATIARLIDMGAESLLLASSLRLIVAQRLIRKNCSHCLTDQVDEENMRAATRLGVTDESKLRQGVGCRQCHNTGFRGRIAVCEVMPITDGIKNAITDHATETEILRVAQGYGFHGLIEYGTRLVRLGMTTPLELLRETST